MGCTPSRFMDSGTVASNEIDAELRRYYDSEKGIIKILLLGAGESGKSTILKQMRLIHGSVFTEEELLKAKTVLYITLFEALEKAINEMTSSWSSVTMAEDVENIYKATEALRKNEDLLEILKSDYLPTDQDYLRIRMRTIGVTETPLKIKCEVTKGHQSFMRFNFIDVGGQRSERRKWISYFEGVHAVLFVVAMSEYDLMLEEDSTKNRLMESLSLFESITGNIFFAHSGFILFLNKVDIFSEKITRVPLSICFKDYYGLNRQEDASEWILSRFMDANTKNRRDLYHHFTCATDTKHMTFIFTGVVSMIIRISLKMTKLI